MKKSILAVAIAGALLAHTSIQAVEQMPPAVIPAPVAPAARVKSSFIETVAAAGKEISAAVGAQTDTVKRLEIFSKLEFSPALRPKLKEVFGNEHIFAMQRTAGPKGQAVYVAKLAPHTYLDENAVAFSWAEFNARTVVNKAGTTMDTIATWPSLSILGTSASGTLEKMSMDFKQSRVKDGLWYGNGVIKVGSVVVRGTTPDSSDFKETFRLEDMSAAFGIALHGKKADLNYGFSIKSILFSGAPIEHANIGLRVVNMPAQALAEADRELKKVQGSGLPEDAQTELMLRTMKAFGKNMVTSGASLVIDDISASYRGNTASIKGRIDFDKVVDADFSSPMAFAKKIIARLDVRLPVAMVNDVARLMGAKQVDASAPNAAEQIETAGKNIAAVVIGKLVNEGFAVMDKGELRSAIEIRQGKLTFNGKAVPLPGVPDGDLIKAFDATKKK
ncbi:DUF945 family protein [Duganella vulcania]|uniref:DUF945 family protein n=1 Tax=Duganella vulcania TaxID=2692166 RepID=A0A845GWB1_9BURK|nr:DUF945 family protein [Duganella vulcania]MYM98165.1 DUF945 family protein [Duganella vulcania]